MSFKKSSNVAANVHWQATTSHVQYDTLVYKFNANTEES